MFSMILLVPPFPVRMSDPFTDRFFCVKFFPVIIELWLSFNHFVLIFFCCFCLNSQGDTLFVAKTIKRFEIYKKIMKVFLFRH